MKRHGLIVLLLCLILGVVSASVLLYRAGQRSSATPRLTTAAQPGPPPDLATLARAACPIPLTARPDHTLACSTCPANSDFAGNSGNAGGWSTLHRLTGHFTAPAADEAILHIDGCESHVNGFGGDFLFTRSGTQWVLMRYVHAGPAGGTCQTLNWTGGRQAVVCQTGDMHQGVATESVQLTTFSATAPIPEDATAPQSESIDTSVFLTLTDDRENCEYDAKETSSPTLLQFAHIDQINLLPTAAKSHPANAEDLQDVEILATVERAPPTRSGACPTGRKRTFRLLFRNLGDHFELTQGKAQLAALNRDDCCEIDFQAKVFAARY